MTNLTPLLNHLSELEAKATKELPPVFSYMVAEIAKNVSYWNNKDFVMPNDRELLEARSHVATLVPMILKEIMLPELLNVVKAAEKALDKGLTHDEYGDEIIIGQTLFEMKKALSDLAAKAKGLGITNQDEVSRG